MWRYTQEISVLIFALLSLTVLVLIALIIGRAVKHRKIPIRYYILLAVFVVIFGCVIFATVAAGNPHPIAPPA